MSVLDWLRDWFDAPRFCPDDGKLIEVVNRPRFDPKTGTAHDSWYWHCPEVWFSHEGGRITWTQTGSDGVHAHGQGRPRWHRLSVEVPA